MTDRRGPRCATGTLMLTLAAAVMVALALLISEEATFGAGRVLGAALVAAWCLAAIFVAMHRPAEPLSILMVLAALIGGVRAVRRRALGA